jgi:hypothetical protein
MINTLFEQIAQVTKLIVSDHCTVDETQENVTQLARLLAQTSKMDFKTAEQNVGSSETDNGVALSPLLAAGCAFNHVRTQQFQRGIHQYLTEARDKTADQKEQRPLDILYAGTGPYATLLFPVLLLHRDLAINLIIIDIYEASTRAVSKLIESAKFVNIQLNSYTDDATKWRPESNHPNFDLIISETMDRGLKREPQVSVFKHLSQFLKPEGCLIPKEISISATLTDSHTHCNLGTIFNLNKDTSEQLLEQNKAYFEGEVSLNQHHSQEFTKLVISTEINTFGSYFIRRNEIEITTDFSYQYLDLSNAKSIPYKYTMDKDPGFTFSLPFYQAPPPPESLVIDTLSGTPYLYVFWQDVLWNFHKPRRSPEFMELQGWLKWENVLLMFDAYKADLQLCIQEVMAIHPPCFKRFETWFLDKFGALNEQDLKALNRSIALSHENKQ